jgi:hypothetical protein
VQYLLRDAKVMPLRDAAAQWRVGLAWQSTRDDPVTARFVEFVRSAARSAGRGSKGK